MPKLTLLIAALLYAGLAQADTGYTTLPFTPDSISADGKSVVGEDINANQLWTWSAAMGQVYIGGVTSINPGAGVPVISSDGTRIAGNALDPITGKSRPSYYDTGTGVWTALPDYGSATSGSPYGATGTVWAMSSNGNYIAGYAYNGGSAATNVRASIWNVQTGTLTNLGSSGLSGPNAQSRVNGISDNGLVAGGRGGNNNALVWTDFDGDGTYTRTTIANEGMVMAVSADGNWVGGIGGSATGSAAYRYNTQTSTLESLGLLNLQAGVRGGTVSAMSADGSVIVGYEDYGDGAPQSRIGFIWRAGIGIQSFDSFLAGYGIDVDNALSFATPMDVSADGLTFTGFGYPTTGTGVGQGWYVSVAGLAPVPEASSHAMLMAGLGVLGLLARRRRAG